jgi:uncharacterized membrane protein
LSLRWSNSKLLFGECVLVSAITISLIQTKWRTLGMMLNPLHFATALTTDAVCLEPSG